MFIIDFPDYDLKIKTAPDKKYVFDIVRKKFVILTPEEWVRQQILHYLIKEKNYRPGLIATEYVIKWNSLIKRCDIVVFDRDFNAKLIIECKRPDMELTQVVFDQAGRYNIQLRVPFLAISNGAQNVVARIDFESNAYCFLPEYPDFDTIMLH
jgi:hypothetical protein